MRKLVSLVVLSVAFFAAQAQTPATPPVTKIGYVDVEYVFGQMPESKQIEAELKSTQTMLRNQIDAKAQDFQKKLADYNANLNTMLDAVRQNTERELRQMQENLDKLQQDAQTTIQNKNQQLLDPVFKKISKSIEDIAKENQFTLILSTQIGGQDVVLFGDEKLDVSDLVLKKMGITPKPAAATPPQPK
jgi:outer membrane protein